MKFLSSLVVGVLATFVGHAGAQPTALSPTVSAPELNTVLATHADTVTVIDIRPPQEYTQAHIPGALSAPYSQWRGPAHSPGTLPALAQLTQAVRQLGVTAADDPIVIVSSGATVSDFGAAARVYWTLKYLGLKRLSILNGGMQAWHAQQLASSQDATPAPVPGQYTPVLNNTILATQADVLAGVNQADVHLIDARPADFYLGKTKAPTAAVAGTIRGALNVAHSVWFAPGSTQIVSAEQARAIAAAQFPDLAPDNITFCNTGHWAATDWFALSELAGLPNIRMYPESLAQWTHAQTPLPMDHTPSRGQQLMETFRNLLHRS